MLAQKETGWSVPDVCLNFINGKWVGGGAQLPVINPTNETVLTHIAEASAQDVDAAVQAAARASRLVSGPGPISRRGSAFCFGLPI
mgnify:CR=1 FL=1